MQTNSNSTDLTCEFLQKQMERAAYCASATLPGDQFRAILQLAMRNKAFAISSCAHLAEMCEHEEVELTGHDLRLLLMLASKAHPRERRRKFRVVK
jgi:hypothetical protein